MWPDLPCAAERLGLTLSYGNTVTLSKHINNVKTKIMSCMAIALSRVAQPNNHIHLTPEMRQHRIRTLEQIVRLIDEGQRHGHRDRFMHIHTIKIRMQRRATDRVNLHLAQDRLAAFWGVPFDHKV